MNARIVYLDQNKWIPSAPMVDGQQKDQSLVAAVEFIRTSKEAGPFVSRYRAVTTSTPTPDECQVTTATPDRPTFAVEVHEIALAKCSPVSGGALVRLRLQLQAKQRSQGIQNACSDLIATILGLSASRGDTGHHASKVAPEVVEDPTSRAQPSTQRAESRPSRYRSSIDDTRVRASLSRGVFVVALPIL